jgi:hypothetical protein
MRQQQIASVVIDPARAQVYAEGWQSWSVVDVVPATAHCGALTPGAWKPPGVS